MQILKFSDKKATILEFCGGKGANLAKLTKAGFKVPQGFIISVKAYYKFIENNKNVKNLIESFNHTFDYQDLDKLEKQSKILRKAFLELDFDEQFLKEFDENLKEFDENTAFSVRSSSTMEDLNSAAFAGAHDTFLNIYGRDEILKHIKLCFASLWQSRAILYREEKNFFQNEACMAVVVQKMVNADFAGVSFSINPVKNRNDEILINANYGLGESVVSGEFNVDEYSLSKSDFSLLSTHIAKKEICIIQDKLGTKEEKVSKEKQEIPCLTEEKLRQIAKLNCEVENYYAFAQDIEWAIEKNELYLLQARAITTLAERWTRDESAERYPNVITPFTWDYVDKAFHISLEYSFKMMNLPSFKGKWFASFNNYIYGNQNIIWLYMQSGNLGIDFKNLNTALEQILQKYPHVYELPKQWMRDLDYYLKGIGALENKVISDNKQAFDFLDDVVKLGTMYFRPNIAISITQSLLYKILKILLEKLVGEKSSFYFDILTSFDESKTAQVNEDLLSLAKLIAKDPFLKSEFEKYNSKELKEKIFGYKISQQFLKFLENHGHREIEFDPYHPTWVEAPEVVIDNIKLLLNSDFSNNKKFQKKKIYFDTKNELFALLPKEWHFGFDELLNLVKTYTLLDDLEHYETTRLSILVRKAAKAIGKHFVKLGIIKDPMDVFFAHMQTISAYKEGKITIDKVHLEIEKEKAQYFENSKKIPAWNLGEEDEIIENESEILEGVAGSIGVSVGEVYLVHSKDDFSHFPKDAILVARTTNPAWTPLFYTAKGVITESGGALSHGAVTAREMKLPAVMSVRNAMKILKNGMKVKVDGGKGRVYILN
ncbi:PEP/pyruvate-binding domain-containing protein [Campylobacter sp. 2457A]|uniref:PEP/pyruvate-binding domain-containing protein n=1 Tax=Campylobacter sp. 2457A TaxID=2735784 RepID=UPI00301B9760|nr:phosphoenolpyruvate synthase [Campylobacter sp. 2457A]